MTVHDTSRLLVFTGGALPTSGVSPATHAADVAALEAAIGEEAAAREAADNLGDIIRLSSVTGTANAATGTVQAAQAHIAISGRQRIQSLWPTTNTATNPTLTIGATAYTIKRRDGSALAAGDLIGGAVYDFVFDPDAVNTLRLMGASGVGDITGLQEELDALAAIDEGKADLTIAGAIPQNARTASFLSRGSFVAEELTGALDASGVLQAGIGWSVTSGVLSIGSGMSAGLNRYFWTGYTREPGASLFVEITVTVNAGTVLIGPYISVGTGSDRRHYNYTPSGSLEVRASDWTTIISRVQSITGMTIASGETATLRLVCDAGGNGYIEGVNAAGVSAFYHVTDVPTGQVQIHIRNTNGFTVDRFAVVADPMPAEAPAPTPMTPVADRSGNLLPEDWLDGVITLEASFDDGWSLGVSSGDAAGSQSITDYDGYSALTLTGNRTCRVRVPIAPVAEFTYHLKIDAYTPPSLYSASCRLAILEYDSGGALLVTNNVQFHAVPVGGVLSGVITRNASTATVLFNVSCVTGATITVSHPSLAASAAQGFRPAGDTLRDVEDRVAAIEAGVGLVTTATLQSFGILPDSTPGRTPPGFTSTGLARITRGAYKGCWLVADDGRLVEGDASPFVPRVHLISPDFQRILLTFDPGYTSASAQGICVDTSGSVDTFWLACSADRTIRHFNLDGTEVVGDRITLTSIDGGSLSGNANGLAYIAADDALLLTMSTGTALYKIDCDPAASPRLLVTYTGDWGGTTNANTPDQLWYDDDSGLLYYSMGQNSETCGVYSFNLATEVTAAWQTGLENVEAAEGFVIDFPKRELVFVNDGDYHNTAEPALNLWLRFTIPSSV